MSVMSRSIKIISIILLLVLLAIIAFVATFDANNYKPQIIEQVENATGRDFSIGGDIGLSIFPWIGLQVEDVTLGNEQGFSERPFASIAQLDVKLNVLPLLKKQVEINTIRLHGLDVSLEVAADKSNNWASLSQAGAASEVEAADTAAVDAEQQAATDDDGASPLQSLKVEGFEFVDALIRYDDRSSGTSATVSDLNLTSSAIEFEQPIDIAFSAHVQNNQPALDSQLKMDTRLTLNPSLTEFKLRDFVFTILAKANEFIKQDENIELRSDIDVLMDEQRITIDSVRLSALGTETLAQFTVSQFKASPQIQGSIEVQAFDAREVAQRAGVELPPMAKADALQQVALSTRLQLQGEKLQADDFKLQLDDSTLSGWIHVLNLASQQLRYDLAFDHLNVNNYLPPASDEPAAAVPEAPVAAEPGAESVAASTGDEKIELPLEMMRKLDLQGDLRIASLTALDYDIKQLLMSLHAGKGVIDIKPLSLQMLEGKVSSAVTVNVQKAVPAYAIKLDIDQVQAGPVANPYLKDVMADKPLELKGTANVKMDVKTDGDSINALKRASKGSIVLDMNETEVDGFDPEYYVRKSIADYVNEKGFGMSKTIMGSYKPRDVTVFEKIHSTVKLADGKARTNDFLMDSERVQIKADGYADILQNRLDFNTSTRLPRGKTAVEKLLDEPLYVRVHGPFAALQYDIDKARLKKSTTDVLEQEAKARAKEKVDAEKKRLEEKAKKELKRSEDKLKNKLQDKLKGLF